MEKIVVIAAFVALCVAGLPSGVSGHIRPRFGEKQLRTALRLAIPNVSIEIEDSFFRYLMWEESPSSVVRETLVDGSPISATPRLPIGDLEDALTQAHKGLGIAGPLRALTEDEVRRLPLPILRGLRLSWETAQREELARLGQPLGLFDPATVPADARFKFATADAGELRLFDTLEAAKDASESIMLRDVGPINAAYGAATGEELPPPHTGLVVDDDAPLIAPVRMDLFEEVRRGKWSTTNAYDKLPLMKVIMERTVNGTVVPFQSLAVYDSGSFDAFYAASDDAEEGVMQRYGEIWVHPVSAVASVSDIKCTCGADISRKAHSTCPLWQMVPYGGRVKRNFLNWANQAVFLVGARLVSMRWRVRVLVDTNSSFYAVSKDATSLVDAKLLDAFPTLNGDSTDVLASGISETGGFCRMEAAGGACLP